MYDEEADLRMLYMAYSSQIEFSKNQQWRVVYYTILVLAGIVGFFRVLQGEDLVMESNDVQVRSVMVILATIATFLSVYWISLHWRSMRDARKQYRDIRKSLSYAFRERVRYSDHYTSPLYDAIFWLPLALTSFAGYTFVCMYLAGEASVFSYFVSSLRNIPYLTFVWFSSLTMVGSWVGYYDSKRDC